MAGGEQVAGTCLALRVAPPCGRLPLPERLTSGGPVPCHRTQFLLEALPHMEEKQASERLCQEELLLSLARYSDIYLYINKPASRRFQSALFQKILCFIFRT